MQSNLDTNTRHFGAYIILWCIIAGIGLTNGASVSRVSSSYKTKIQKHPLHISRLRLTSSTGLLGVIETVSLKHKQAQ